MGVTTNERNGPSTNNCSLTMSIQCTCLACSAFRSKINLEFIYNEKLLCTKYYTLNNPYQKCPSPPNWTKNKGTLLKQKLQDRNSINCKLRIRPIYCIALSSTTISLGRKHRVLCRIVQHHDIPRKKTSCTAASYCPSVSPSLYTSATVLKLFPDNTSYRMYVL